MHAPTGRVRFPAQRIATLNERRDQGTLERMLRLSVEPGGCSGFSYKFAMEDKGSVDEAEDMCAEGMPMWASVHFRVPACCVRSVFEEAGAKVVVDEGSLALLEGAPVL